MLKLNQLHLAIALTLPLYAQDTFGAEIDPALLARGNGGDVVAQRQIGEQLLHGDGVNKDTNEGVRWLTLASQQGDSSADVTLGDFYSATRDNEVDYARALTHFRRAANVGNLEAADTLAQTLIEHALRSQTPKDVGDAEIKDALPYLKPSVARRNQTSCFYSGYLSFIGRGLPHNAVDAEKNMRCAADQGNAMAAFWVAGALLADVPMPMKAGSAKVEEARKYLVAAKDRGHAGAAQLLASLPPEAPAVAQVVKPTTPAAKPAPVKVEVTPEPAPPARIVVDAPRVSAPVPQPVEPEKPDVITAPIAQVECAAPSTADTSTRPAELDQIRAELAAANEKIARLQEQLASVRTHSEDVLEGESLNRQALAAIAKGDYATAIPKLNTAIQLGDVAATANLGLMYLQGLGVTASTDHAIDLLVRAANEGNRTAAENLGRIFEGLRGKRDVARAVEWYRKAQSLGSIRALPALKRLGAAS